MPRATKEDLLIRSGIRKIHWRLAPSLIILVFAAGYLLTAAKFYFTAVFIGYCTSLLVSELIVARRHGQGGIWHCFAVATIICGISIIPFIFLTEGFRRPILDQATIEEVVTSKIHSYSGYEPAETRCDKPHSPCSVTAVKPGFAYRRLYYNTRVDGKPCPSFGVLVRWEVYECKSGYTDVSAEEWQKLNVGDVLKVVVLK